MATPAPTKISPATITSLAQSEITQIPTAIVAKLPSSVTATLCFPEPTEASKVNLPGTSITLHWMFIDVGGLCMALACLLCLINFITHLIWRSNLKEQKHLMRITILPAIYAIFAWVAVDFYSLETYLTPIPKLYEIYCVVTFFQFMIEVLHPDEATRKDFFIGATRMNRRGKKPKHDRGSLRWFYVLSMMEYISLFMILVVTILEEIMYTLTCPTGKTRQLLDIVLEVFSFAFTFQAIGGVIRMYRRFRQDYQGTKLLRKFFTFKIFVLLMLHQQLIIEIIIFTGVVKPTEYMSAADFQYGVQQFMICCEAFIFSIVYITGLSGWCYRGSKSGNYMTVPVTKKGPDASVGAYLLAVLFPVDIFQGFWFSLRTLARLPRGRKGFDYTGGTGVGWEERQNGDSGHFLDPNQEAKLQDNSDSDDSGSLPPPPATDYPPYYSQPGNYNTAYNGANMA